MIIKQGESFPIYITLKQDGVILTPDMIQDLKICIGGFHKQYSDGGVRFDDQAQQWWVHPTQAETLAMPEGTERINAHVKYHDGAVCIEQLGTATIRAGCCEEVF